MKEYTKKVEHNNSQESEISDGELEYQFLDSPNQNSLQNQPKIRTLKNK